MFQYPFNLGTLAAAAKVRNRDLCCSLTVTVAWACHFSPALVKRLWITFSQMLWNVWHNSFPKCFYANSPCFARKAKWRLKNSDISICLHLPKFFPHWWAFIWVILGFQDLVFRLAYGLTLISLKQLASHLIPAATEVAEHFCFPVNNKRPWDLFFYNHQISSSDNQLLSYQLMRAGDFSAWLWLTSD